MAGKIISISDDSGVTWSDFPGSTGEFNREGDRVTDTIFGQTFASEEAGLLQWSLSANAVFKGFVGYQASLKKHGSSTAFSGEAMSQVSGQRYKIDDATKEIWNRNATFTVFDGAADVTAQVESFNYLFGEIVFNAGYSVVGAITVDGAYFPTVQLARVDSYTLTQTAEAVGDSDFDKVQANGGYYANLPGLRSVEISIDGIYDSAQDLDTELENRSEIIIEINPDGMGRSVARGFFRVTEESRSGDVGAQEEVSYTFPLNVIQGAEIPFGWRHTNDSTIPEAIKKALTAWETEAKYDFRYLQDGTNGVSGTGVITDISLEGGLDAMNEFSLEVTGDGSPTTLP